MTMLRWPRLLSVERLVPRREMRHGATARPILVLLVMLFGALSAPAVLAAQGASEHPSRTFWQDNNGTPPAFSARGARPAMQPQPLQRRCRSTGDASRRLVAGAPHERTRGSTTSSRSVISLPDPERRLPALHGRGVARDGTRPRGQASRDQDLRRARASTIPSANHPHGHHAARLPRVGPSPNGSWYIDPYYHLDDSVYASYYARDLQNPHGTFVENASGEPEISVMRTGSTTRSTSLHLTGPGIRSRHARSRSPSRIRKDCSSPASAGRSRGPGRHAIDAASWRIRPGTSARTTSPPRDGTSVGDHDLSGRQRRRPVRGSARGRPAPHLPPGAADRQRLRHLLRRLGERDRRQGDADQPRHAGLRSERRRSAWC